MASEDSDKPESLEQKVWRIIHSMTPDHTQLSFIHSLFTNKTGTPLIRVIPFKRKKQ